MLKRGEIVPKEQFLLFPTLFYIYIFNFRSQITYSFVKCGCSIYCFPHSLNSDMSEVRISRSISMIPLEFEITRVDSIYLLTCSPNQDSNQSRLCPLSRLAGIFAERTCPNSLFFCLALRLML